MSKKTTIITILFVFTAIIAFMSYKLESALEKKDSQEQLLQHVSFSDLKFLTTSPLAHQNVVLSLFHPSCDYCQADAEQFLKSNDQLQNFTILWVSYDEKDSIQKFSKTYGLDTLANMHFAYIDIETMLARYGDVKFPTFLAYDEHGQLLKKIVGLTKPEDILKVYQME